jgi:hypothetical protein
MSLSFLNQTTSGSGFPNTVQVRFKVFGGKGGQRKRVRKRQVLCSLRGVAALSHA